MGNHRSLPAHRATGRLRRLCAIVLAAAASAVLVVAASPSVASADPFTYVDVSTGYHAACAVTNDGSAVCWGWNQAGSLGTADTSEKVATPSRVRLPDGQRFASIAAGEYFTTCGITTAGSVYCWGQHHLGSYFSPTSTSPVRTELPAGVRARSMANGGSIACAVSTTDELWCWGDVLDFGNGSTEATRTPERVPMPDGSGVRSVDVGPGTACAVTTTERLYCWGSNGDGETGIGYVSNKVNLPAAVLLPSGVVPASVSVGLGRVCALDTTGTGWCWGDNYEGSFGDGTYTDSRTPRRVLTPGGEALTQLQTAWYHTCGIGSSGTTWCWGRGGFGELGTGTTLGGRTFRQPVLPSGVTLRTVATGLATTCAIDNSSRVWCWTGSDWGVAGTGDLTKSLFPRLTAPIGSPTVSAAGARETGAEHAVIRASVNPNGSSTTFYVEVSTDPQFTDTTRHPGTTVLQGGRYLPVDIGVRVTGLAPRTVHHARVVAVNAHGTVTGAAVSFTTLGAEPSFGTASSGGIGGTTARASVTVDPGLLRTSVHAEISASADFATSQRVDLEALTGDAAESREATFASLAPRTVHHVRFVATNRLGTVTSATLTFTTLGSEPRVTGTTATSTARSVTVAANVAGGDLAGSAVAHLSTSEDFDGAVQAGTAEWPEGQDASPTFTFRDLAPRTKYWVRVTASNALGTSTGESVSVRTRGGVPVVGTLTAATTGTTSATTEATVDATGLVTSLTAQVATDSAFTQDLDEHFIGRFSGEGATARRLVLTDLEPGTRYHVRYVASNDAGTTTSDAVSFVTPRPVGVEINNGDDTTSDPVVTLRITAPPGAVAMRLADNPAMRNARVLPVTSALSWTFPPASGSPATRGVWVTFHQEDGRASAPYGDTIQLEPPAADEPGDEPVEDEPVDDAAPVVVSARIVKVSANAVGRTSAARTRLSVSGRDASSGITQVQIRTKTGITRHSVSASRKLARVFASPSPTGVWVRLVDAAGNASKWVRVRG